MNTTIEGPLKPMMNGDDEAVMKGLLLFTNTGQLTQMREYMSELWARGVTKEQFLKWAEGQSKTPN